MGAPLEKDIKDGLTAEHVNKVDDDQSTENV